MPGPALHTRTDLDALQTGPSRNICYAALQRINCHSLMCQSHLQLRIRAAKGLLLQSQQRVQM